LRYKALLQTHSGAGNRLVDHRVATCRCSLFEDDEFLSCARDRPISL